MARIASGELEAGEQQLVEFLATCQGLQEPAPLYVAASDVQNWLNKSKLPISLFSGLQPLLNRAEEFIIKVPAIRKNLRRISKSAFISPPHISIHTFGPIHVLLNGKPLTLSDWQTRETRDLFFFFLGSKPQSKEEIGAIFWPDLSPARLKMRFKTNLYRLRHAVGQNTILFGGERYGFNKAIDYEYDLEIYQELVEKARKEKNPMESAKLLQSAADLVTGTYLVDIDSEWGDLIRSQFENQHHANLIRLARLYLETGQTARVIEICQAALTNNNLIEEAYRLIMSAHAQVGNTTEATRVYHTCKNILLTELGVNPSRETEKLFRSLF